MQKMLHTAEEKFLVQLAKEYPTVAAASSEIINLQAILRLPKPTEHFMSDLHGESDAFTHILGNASGVIKEKVDRVLAGEMSDAERAEFATLIYYPAQKLAQLKPRQSDLGSMVPKDAVPADRRVPHDVLQIHPQFCAQAPARDFAYILDELLHAHFEDHDKEFYYGVFWIPSLTLAVRMTLSPLWRSSSSGWPCTACTSWVISSTAAPGRTSFWMS